MLTFITKHVHFGKKMSQISYDPAHLKFIVMITDCPMLLSHRHNHLRCKHRSFLQI